MIVGFEDSILETKNIKSKFKKVLRKCNKNMN
jgi:hypothetical protein